MARRQPPGITEAHIRIPLEVLQSPAFIALPASAVKLYIDMISALRTTNNGNINAAMTDLRHRGWTAPATLAKSLRQLEAVGLIAKTRETVGVNRGSKMCNLYRFTDRDVFGHPKLNIEAQKETRDYRKFTSLTEARKAVDAAAAPKPKKKTTLQKLKRDATETVAMTPINATETVVTPHAPTTETVASTNARKPRKANGNKALQPIALIRPTPLQ